MSFEIVFVDDGSSDESVKELQELAAADERVMVLELARNFGHQVAITAGLDFTRGKADRNHGCGPAGSARSAARVHCQVARG